MSFRKGEDCSLGSNLYDAKVVIYKTIDTPTTEEFLSQVPSS